METNRPPLARRALIVVFLMLVPVAIWSAWDYIEARRLARSVAQIRAQGDPVDTLELHSPRAADADNASRYYGSAAMLVDVTGIGGPMGVLSQLDRAQGDPASIGADLEAVVDRNRESGAMLARATALEYYGDPAGLDYNYRESRLLDLARVVDLRLLTRVTAGDAAGAAQALHEQLRLMRPLAWSARNPGNAAISGFGAYVSARAAMAVGPVLELRPSAAEMAQLQREFEALDDDRAIEQGLKAERAFQISRYWNQINAWYAPPPRAFDVPAGATFVIARPLIIHRLNSQLALMDRLLKDARRPWPQRLEVDAPTDDQVASMRRGRFFYFGSGPWDEFVRYMQQRRAMAVASSLAMVRSAATAVAVARFSRDHNKPPDSLQALVPEYLKAVPIDPYSGQPLIYRQDAERIVVYSVGANSRDDGGRVTGQWSRRWTAYARPINDADLGVGVRSRSSM